MSVAMILAGFFFLKRYHFIMDILFIQKFLAGEPSNRSKVPQMDKNTTKRGRAFSWADKIVV